MERAGQYCGGWVMMNAKTLLLFVTVLLGNGCATSALIKSAKNPEMVPDRIDRIERAFVTPDNHMLVCLTGALPQTATTGRFMLDVPLNSMFEPNGYGVDKSTARVVLPRGVIRE